MFLAVSSVVTITLLVCVREVLLPFMLALIIAYVLSPLVERVERFRVPRAAAILMRRVMEDPSLARLSLNQALEAADRDLRRRG